ncbi:MAG: ribonuclease Z [Anaerolineales bacterium]
MFEILFLGTSASAPSIQRGLAGAVISHNEYRFLADAGEGTQRQILQSGIGFKRLTRVLLTHHHLDHILGLGGLLSTFLKWESIERLEIFGGRMALERARILLYDVVMAGGVKPPMPLILTEITPGVFFEAEDFTIRAIPVTHRGPGCLGYIFEEKSRRPFLSEKADALGVPFGPQRRELVEGRSVTLADGRVIQPQDVLGEPERGCKFVFIGDTGRTDNLVEFCRDADGLVIESTYTEEEADMAKKYSHLTAKMAAELAAAANVKKLILTHISRRYRGKDILAEAQRVFPQVVVARDFDRFQIKKEIGK